LVARLAASGQQPRPRWEVSELATEVQLEMDSCFEGSTGYSMVAPMAEWRLDGCGCSSLEVAHPVS
jgi:hypothetical protein